MVRVFIQTGVACMLGRSALWAGLTLVTLIANEANAAVSGRINCNNTTRYCLIEGLAINGDINETVTAELSQLIEAFRRQLNPKVQSEHLSGTSIKLDSLGGSVSAA